MTKEEYLKIVQASATFQGLKDDLKEMVLAAEGGGMDRMLAILQRAEKSLLKARDEFVSANKEIEKRLQKDLTALGKEKLKDDEMRQTMQDQKKEEEMLSQINKL